MKTPIYLDTNAIIDFVEQRHESLQLLFVDADRGLVDLLTSELALAEVLVRPFRQKEDWLLKLYEGLLAADGVVRMVPIDIRILRESAKIRATVGGSLPDSIHVATAVSGGCRYLVSSDRRLRTPDDIERIAAKEISVDLLRSWR